jgi:hypothetical protein
MKPLLILSVCLLTCLKAFSQSTTPLPFSVSLGGNAAVAEAGKPFASVGTPVAADADISVGVSADMVIINVTKLGPDGSPEPGSQPAIILLQKSKTGSLAKTMNQQKIAPGSYLMSVTAAEQTALVRFTIK